MGFRTTFTIEDCCITWPQWFRDKHKDWVIFSASGVISSAFECKTYDEPMESLPGDIQKVLVASELPFKKIVLAYLHEDGDISRVLITTDKIHFYTASEWVEIDELPTFWRGDLPENIKSEGDKMKEPDIEDLMRTIEREAEFLRIAMEHLQKVSAVVDKLSGDKPTNLLGDLQGKLLKTAARFGTVTNLRKESIE